MTFLITTTQAFWCVDEDRYLAYRIDTGNGFYFGISFDRDRIYVAAQRAEYCVMDDWEAQRGVILVFDYDLNKIDELEPNFPLRDLHQIYAHEDRLWVAATGDNVVGIYDGNTWEKWLPFGPAKDPNHPDEHHINSIYIDGERIYLVGHSADRGQVHVFRLSDKIHETSIDMGRGSHNLWPANGVLYTLSSASGEIISTGGDRYPVYIGSFVRGAAITEDYAYFGVSWNTHRSKQNRSNCMVVRIDKQDRQRFYFGLRGYGMVHDLRAPGRLDRTHPSYVGRDISLKGLENRFPVVELARHRLVTVKRATKQRLWALLRRLTLTQTMPRF